jgi:hypothetical protein
MLAEFAEPAAVLDPVVTVVMRLLAPPAMTDVRIAQTEGTAGSTHYERTPRFGTPKLDVAASATGRELHPLESSAFHGELSHQLWAQPSEPD